MKLPGFLQQIGIGVVTRGWSHITALVLAITAARLLGRKDFGLYAIASAFVVLLQALMYGGIYDFIIKDRTEGVSLNTCFWMNIAFGAIGMVALDLLAIPMGAMTHSSQVTELMLWLAPSAIIASASSWQEALMLRRARLLEYYTQCIIVESLAATISFMLLLNGFGLYSLVIYRYAQLTLSSVCYYLMQRVRPAFEWHIATAREAWQFSIKIYCSRVVGILASYSGDILIGTLISPSAAGSYRLASRIVLGVSEIVYQPVGTIAWVSFARTEGNPQSLGFEWMLLLRLLSLTAWPALGGLSIVSNDILPLVVGPGWSEAAVIIQILAIARILSAFEVFLDATLGILNRVGLILKIRTIAAASSVVLLLLLSHFGAAGAALAQVVVAGGMAIIAASLALKATQTDLLALLTKLLPGIFCTGAVVIGALSADKLFSITSTTPIVLLLLAVGGGSTLYFLTLAILYRCLWYDARSTSEFKGCRGSDTIC